MRKANIRSPKNISKRTQRRKLLGEITRLAEIAIFGTLSETYRTVDKRAAIAKEMDLGMVRI